MFASCKQHVIATGILSTLGCFHDITLKVVGCEFLFQILNDQNIDPTYAINTLQKHCHHTNKELKTHQGHPYYPCFG